MRSNIILKCTGVVIILVAALGGLSAKSVGSKSGSRAAQSAPDSSALESSPIQADEQDTQGLVIAIRPIGFTPAQLDLVAGSYLFIVQNRCGIRDLTFRLVRDTGEKLHEVHDQKPQWKKQFDLHPGTYILSVVEHPEWRSVITVTAK
jgi:hypothetical protein